jgi:CHAT domain-containing protein/tetratricopeptide (TPR) repeat protein
MPDLKGTVPPRTARRKRQPAKTAASALTSQRESIENHRTSSMTVLSHRRRWLATFGAAAALCAGGWVWLRSRPPSDTERVPTVVTDGLSTRWFAGRLSGLRHIPFDPATPELPSALLLAEARASAAARDRPSADTLWALGVQQLVNGKADAAVASLERAQEMAPDRAPLLADLAAAYLATSTERPDRMVRGLSAAVRSGLLSPSAAATFNEALALDELGLWSGTLDAWARLQPLEKDPALMDDARERLPEAAKGRKWPEVVDDDLARVKAVKAGRDAVESTWLAAWARACAAGDAASMASAANAVSEAGRNIAEATADRYWPALASHLASVSHPGRCRALADGITRYADGRDLYDRDRLVEAGQRFTESVGLLDAAGSPLAGWARLYAAVVHGHQAQTSEAVGSLAAIVRRSDADGHVLLAARARYSLGVIHSVQGNYSAALSAQHHARHGFERARAQSFEAEAWLGLAETYAALGEWAMAWSYFHAAIARPPDRASKREALLVSAGMTALQQDLPGAALAFQSEAVALSTRSGQPVGAAKALLQRARILHRLAQGGRASADLAQAQRDIATMTDPSLRARLDAEAAAVRGMLTRSTDPRAAYDALSRAIAFYRGGGFDPRLPELLLERARISMASSRWREAEQDLAASIDVLDARRAAGAPLKVRYSDASYDIVDEMLRLQVRNRATPAAALDVAERARARALSNAAGSTPSAGWLEQLQRQLPDRQVLLYYASLEDRLLIWRVDAAGVQQEEHPIGRSALAALVERYRDALLARDDRAGVEAGARLAAIVLGRFETAIVEGTTLVIVPDGALNRLAFASLPLTGRPGRLIDRATVVLSPSARFWSHGDSRQARVPTSVLAIGDPAADWVFFPDARSLPLSAREAREVASLYRVATTLIGEAATRSAFVKALGRTDVVHFAGHSRSGSESPLLSYVLLAPDGDDELGAVFANDLAPLRLDRVSLVVLANCESALGRTFRGEGALSLARPFLAAGVPNVVASLWNVSDEHSHDLSVRFHRFVRAGRPPPDALRDAQLALARDGRPAGSWAGFVAIGTR